MSKAGVNKDNAMKKKVFASLVAAMLVAVTMVSCDAIKSAFQLKNCEYSYKSISGVKVAGIDFSSSNSILQISNLTKIANLIAGNFSSLPLEMTVNVNVKNPGEVAAGISNVKYDVAIDNIDVASGDLQKAFRVEPGKTAVLPVNVKTDLANLLNADNRSQVVNIVKNFAGINDQESTVKLKLRPTILQGNSSTGVTLPAIPVTFKYNGKKK